MRISKTSQYAIRALIFINQQSIKDPVPISLKEVAKGINSPEHFTAKLLQPLSKSQLVGSVKGPGGGFIANIITGQTNIRTIVETIEGTDFFTKCFLGLSGCSDSAPCPAHFSYKILKDDMIKLFESLTIDSLTSNLESNKELFRLIG